jgi:hypothetical protein
MHLDYEMWLDSDDLIRLHQAKFLVFLLGDYSTGNDAELRQVIELIPLSLRLSEGVICPVIFRNKRQTQLAQPIEEDDRASDVEPVCIYMEFDTGDQTTDSLRTLDMPLLASKIVVLPQSERAVWSQEVERQWSAIVDWVRTFHMSDGLHVLPRAGDLAITQGRENKRHTVPTSETSSSFSLLDKGLKRHSAGNIAPAQLSIELLTLMVQLLHHNLGKLQTQFIGEAEAAARLRTELGKFLLHSQKRVSELQNQLFAAEEERRGLEADLQSLKIDSQARILDLEAKTWSLKMELSEVNQSPISTHEKLVSSSSGKSQWWIQSDHDKIPKIWRKFRLFRRG